MSSLPPLYWALAALTWPAFTTAIFPSSSASTTLRTHALGHRPLGWLPSYPLLAAVRVATAASLVTSRGGNMMRSSVWVWRWVVTYLVLGSILFAAFLPWT